MRHHAEKNGLKIGKKCHLFNFGELSDLSILSLTGINI
jgi:hypothetical protein